MTSDSSQCCGCQSDEAGSPPSESNLQSDSTSATLNTVSMFEVPLMDCPSEENLIRTAFASFGEAVAFEFDIPNRKVNVYHADSSDLVETTMKSVGLGARCLSLEQVDAESAKKIREETRTNDLREAWVLKWLLGINAVMFFFELAVGIVAQSAGLIADSLDMFADAAVYTVALYAVGKASQAKLKAAHLSGWLEAALAMGLLIEVIRRAFMGSEPVSLLMMGIGSLALVANVACLMLIYQVRNNGTHMKASMIFSANDVLANAGVILAGGLVALTGSQIPDLVIGVIIGLVVLNGARRILMLR
ncbi:cation transporter [Spongiibacter sp. KMU-158]|uniref:Cation transporter n=1 Tax=Spongiibacter pelagi TaxID=2760804 RepID=A0A927C676_9GAMM|nr:cation transporter [Spongiibacter pelagi]MBD2860306.1 cation transporter [Spongiibacter pelagi]